MAPPSQTQEAPPVPSFANDISPFPPSQYSSPPPGGPPSLEPQVGFGSFFTSQPQRAARAQSRAVRTFGKAQEESDPRMRGYVEPPAGQGRTTPVMLPPSLPAQNHATPAFFRPWPPPGPSQQQYGPHVVDSYHPAQHAGTSISRSRGPASVTSGRASRADTPSVRAPSMDRGKPRTAAEVYMAGTQAKTTMGDKVMSAIDGLHQLVATFGGEINGLAGRLDSLVTQSSSTHLIVSSQKDDFKSLRDKMHELQNGQRALGTLEEIREEVAGQVGPALDDLTEALETKIDHAVRDVRDFRRMLQEHLDETRDQLGERNRTRTIIDQSAVQQLLDLLLPLPSVDLTALSCLPQAVDGLNAARTAFTSATYATAASGFSPQIINTLELVRDELQVHQSLALTAKLDTILAMVEQLLSSALGPTTGNISLIPLTSPGAHASGAGTTHAAPIQPWPTPQTPSLLLGLRPAARLIASADTTASPLDTRPPAQQISLSEPRQLEPIARRLKQHLSGLFSHKNEVPSTRTEVAIHVAGITEALAALETATGVPFSLNSTATSDSGPLLAPQVGSQQAAAAPMSAVAPKDTPVGHRYWRTRPQRGVAQPFARLPAAEHRVTAPAPPTGTGGPTAGPTNTGNAQVRLGQASNQHAPPFTAQQDPVSSHDVFGPSITIPAPTAETQDSQTQPNTQSAALRRRPAPPFEPVIRTRAQRSNAERQSQSQENQNQAAHDPKTGAAENANAPAATGVPATRFCPDRLTRSRGTPTSLTPSSQPDAQVSDLAPHILPELQTKIVAAKGTQANAIEISSDSDSQHSTAHSSDASLKLQRHRLPPALTRTRPAVKQLARRPSSSGKSKAKASGRPLMTDIAPLTPQQSLPRPSVSKASERERSGATSSRIGRAPPRPSAPIEELAPPSAIVPPPQTQTCESIPESALGFGGEQTPCFLGPGSAYQEAQSPPSTGEDSPLTPLDTNTTAELGPVVGAAPLKRNDSRQYATKRRRSRTDRPAAPQGPPAKKGRFETLRDREDSTDEDGRGGRGTEEGPGKVQAVGRNKRGARVLWDEDDELDLDGGGPSL